MNKIISTFLIIAVLFSSIAFLNAGDNCNYTFQINECREANKAGSVRGIKDFMCPSEINEEKMIYNIILNDKFYPIDEDANKYLDYLYNDKTRFFGPDQKEPFLKGVDEIYNAFGKGKVYEKLYKAELPKIMAETVNCLPFTTTSVNEMKDYFVDGVTINNFIEDKISRRRKVAIDILTLNKQQVRDDSNKKFMQIRRTMYDSVSNLFMVNLGYLMRIMFKWASKTKNPY